MTERHPAETTGDLSAVLAFAWSPAAYMDASWWCEDWLPPSLFERLRENPRSRRHLSNFLLRTLGLGDGGVIGRDSPEADLALVEGRRLQRLVVLAGVTLLSGHIARVLRGPDRRRIKDALGDADYEFAVRRGRLLLQQAKVKGGVPGVDLSDSEGVDEASRRCGVASLATALQDAPAAVVRRVQLKLPRTFVERHWEPLGPRSAEFLRLFRLLDRQVQEA
ncbi:MAG: hypothetical protein F4X99_07070 [Gammaproteobacteria bacterium]|nr:hypothetical protein [Gammaproteobacteria bacterium]MYE83556.1 hypothetical protein [Gammaproteobacteria bacterium]